LIRETDHSGDLRAALAANRENPLAAASAAEKRKATEPPQSCREPASAPDVFQRVRDLLGHTPPVAQPHRPLYLLVVSAEELVDDGRIARAPRVLQEKGVKKFRADLGGETDRSSEAEADPACARGVTTRMPFGEIERMRQPREDAG
jgi:hypothetical protein